MNPIRSKSKHPVSLGDKMVDFMSDLGQSLFHPAPPADADPLLCTAVERAVDRVEPRLKQIRGFPWRYRPFIEPVLSRARELAASIPGPVMVDSEHYIKDPFVHALFGSPEDIRRFLCSTQTMRDHVARHGNGELFALLSMRRTEKAIFGMENNGAVLHRDVPQKAVTFTDHQLLALATTEAEARENVLWYLFDRHVEQVAIGLDQLRTEHQRLTQEKDLALARLRGAPPEKQPARQKELDAVLAELSEVAGNLTLERFGEVFDHTLSQPEECLALEIHNLTLDSMGIVRSEACSEGAVCLDFVDLQERDLETRSIVLVHCRRVDAISPAERMEEAKKWLG